MSQAIPMVMRASHCSRVMARLALRATHDGEWHHVSKYGNRVSYYDPQLAVDALLQFPLFVPCCSTHEALRRLLGESSK